MKYPLSLLFILTLITACGAAPDVQLVPLDPPGVGETVGIPLTGKAHGNKICYNENQLQTQFAHSEDVFVEDGILKVKAQWVFSQATVVKDCEETDIQLEPINNGQFSDENPDWITTNDNQPLATAEVDGDHVFVYVCNEIEENEKAKLDCNNGDWVVMEVS
ncbi:MAG: hypothetical protein CMH61_01060 [Nanoarchaeota archaeon]|nr:hypothetical protein [Nanoarchaeota archaeon]|tara:strand:- start:208 stop:693 length:486 start_codon:yes stop_codon:yes gene_type:complete